MVNKNIILLNVVNKKIFIIVFVFLLAFAGPAVAGEESAEKGEAFDFSTFSLIKLLGVCALVCASATFLSAMFRRKLSRHFLKIHKTLGWLTIIFALSHGIGMMILF